MSGTKDPHSPGSETLDDNDRSQIRQYNQINKFRVGDKVNIVNSDGSREGPYLVASIISTGIYTLSYESGLEVQNGEELEENDLVLVVGTARAWKASGEQGVQQTQRAKQLQFYPRLDRIEFPHPYTHQRGMI